MMALAAPVQAANTPISVLIYDYGITDTSTLGMVANLAARQTAAGNTPTISTAIGTSIDLSSYGQVWDLGANIALTSDQVAYYTAYLQNGGTLFVMGENAGWGTNRNNSISSLVSGLGGGTVTVTQNSPNNQTIASQFLVANQTADVNFAAIGAFSSAGTGTCITSGCGAAAWGVGKLANAPKGALISVLDVNFLATQYLAQDFTDNLIAYLYQQQQISGGNLPDPNAKRDIVDTTGAALASQLGTSLNYRFDGGVLSADQDVAGGFTVTAHGGGIVYAGTDRTFSGVFSDDGNTASGGIVISNSGSGGSLILGADNTFSGGFTVLSGAQLQIDRAGELGSGTLHLIGSATAPAYLRVTGTTTIANAITVAGDPVFDIASGTTTTITGVIADGGSAGDLVKTGAGALVLTGTNTYTGPTTITAGTLALSGTGSIATSSGVAVGGVFDIAATTAGAAIQNLTGAGSVVLGAQTLSLSGSSNAFGGTISGTGGLTLASGAAVLTGTNTYTGPTTITAGTLALSGTGSNATSSSVAVGGVFDIAATTAGAAIQNLTGAGSVVLGAQTLSLSGNSNAFGGAISGTGGLTLASGAAVLTGTNTYTGPTTITAGTLQIGNGGTTGSIAGNITNNGALAFNRSNSATYGGVISGTGTVSVSGGGTLVLTGANTYTGQTSIAAGSTLQIGNGGTTGSIVSNVANQGVLAFNRSDTVTFSGAVTGDGTLVQNGTGKVIVTTNYTGKTIVNSGTLQIGNGATSGTVTGNIVNNANVVYGQAAATTYAGIISGTGSLAVSGGGVVVLNGSNTYTGPTTVTAGSLIIGDASHPMGSVLGGVTVGNGALVGGYGSIGGSLTASGGIVSPGNSIGTLTVSGNYTQSATSTLNIEVSPAGNDKLVVGGTAQLGGTLALNLAQGDYGTRAFTLLTASNVSGTFATITYAGASSDVVYGVVYAPKEVDLAMAPKVSGQIYGDLVTATLDTAVVLNSAVIDRLGDASQTGWSVWSKTLTGASHTDASGTISDFNTQLWGVISGADYQFDGGSKLSGVFAYTHNQLGVHGEGSKASADGYFIALAGHLQTEGVALDVSGFLQHNDIDVARDNGSASRLSGKTGNFVGGGSLQVGYPLYGGDVVPFARLTVASVGTDSFTETGALSFSGNAVTRATVRGSWGVQLSHSYTTEDGLLIQPHALIGLENEFNKANRDMPLVFAGTAFQAPAAEPEDVSALVGAGVMAKLANSLEFSLDANGRFSNNQQEGILSFSAKSRV